MRERLPLIVSIAALLVAVAGSTPIGNAAYQAVVPRDSVGSAQLKHNAVTASKIAPNAIRAGHVLNGSLLAEDFKQGQLPQGPKGDKGDKGDAGKNATRLWAAVSAAGSITSEQGATGASKTETGSYTVDFNRDVSTCAVLATQGTTYANAYASARPVSGTPNRVSVSIYTTPVVAGLPPRSEDAGFSVAVFC